MNKVIKVELLCLLFLAGTTALSQPIYRCEYQGKIGYSDEPCMNAKVVDVLPTEGAHSLSGKKTSNARSRQEETRKMIDNILMPVTGLTHEQMKVERRRMKLPAQDKFECTWLDTKINAKNVDEATLYQARKRYFDLRC
ncbi:MAG: DUF4124 domain-containing protein [Burkholderiaceae bacterium]|nr:DUF4124 domain-containing protein [Burkholderiaceae bacterium]